jgi:hypothetical protein
LRVELAGPDGAGFSHVGEVGLDCLIKHLIKTINI